MKVIFITREGYQLSGARIRCYGFAKELARHNISTELFSFADNLGAEYGENEFKMGIVRKLNYNAKAYRRLVNNIDKNTIIFMQRLNYHSLAPFLISLLRKNKFVFDCDDWNIRENPSYHLGFYPSSKMEYFTRKIAGYSHACIVASRFLENYLGKFNRNTYYIPTGVDTEVFDPGKYPSRNKSEVVFSWVGTAYHKEMGENLKFTLDCFSSLASKYENIFLDIAGEGRYFQELKIYAHELEYKERIKIRDWIDPSKIPTYLSSIDIGLLPLIQDTNFNKAKSPTKLFEYMAMTKPTVSSNIGEAKEIIVDGKTGFLANSESSFIAKMQELIVNRSLRDQIGSEARKTVMNQYSLVGLGKQLNCMLQTL